MQLSHASRREAADANRAPLLPKLRGEFAEFLNEGSHSRLRIFSSPTCVGLRYGYPKDSLEDFLGSVASATLLSLRTLPYALRIVTHRIYLADLPTALNLHVQS